jgi:hypothetical protein
MIQPGQPETWFKITPVEQKNGTGARQTVYELEKDNPHQAYYRTFVLIWQGEISDMGSMASRHGALAF